jgi:hypothetical protein
MTPLRIVSVLLLTLCTLHAQEQKSDWTQFRGPGGQGISLDRKLPVKWSEKENLVFKVPLPGAGTSSPVILGSRIYLTCYSGYGIPGQRGDLNDLKLHLLALDRENGKTIWQKEIAPAAGEQQNIREGHGYASATPITDGERLYVFFGKTGVFAFDLEGKELWKADVGSQINGWGSSNSPILFENLLIVNASVESESLVALDKKSGKEIWRAKGLRESWNTPILVKVDANRHELVVAIFGKILGFNPKTGEQLWSCATDIGWYMVPSLVVHEGVVYCIGGRSGGGLAVKVGGKGDVTSSHRLWTIKSGSNVSSPVFHDGHLYWANDNTGVAFCAEAKTGKIVYEEKLERAEQVYASAVLADGKIYYTSRNGRVFVVAAKPTFELLGMNQFPERSVYNSTPAIAGSRIYLRSNQFLYCIGHQ